MKVVFKQQPLKAMQEAKLEPTERFVAVDIIAFMEIPKSWSTVKRMEAEYGALQHTTKPDLDNIVKAALDGIEGAVYVSDKQVTSIKAKKMYCHPDRVQCFIYRYRGQTQKRKTNLHHMSHAIV